MGYHKYRNQSIKSVLIKRIVMSKEILVVEDEASIADNIKYALETEGFTPVWVETIGDAQEALASRAIDLIILDIGLPDGRGTEFCKELRKTSNIPVVFLTAMGSEIDRVVGLEIGADDYVTKPFSPRELTARVKAILRRSNYSSSSIQQHEQICCDQGFDVDEEKCSIIYFGTTVNLSRYEYLMLKTMVDHPGRIYSRQQLMNHVWEEPDMSMERTVDTHIKTIRAKLKKIYPEVDAIITHRGFGYAINENL